MRLAVSAARVHSQVISPTARGVSEDYPSFSVYDLRVLRALSVALGPRSMT